MIHESPSCNIYLPGADPSANGSERGDRNTVLSNTIERSGRDVKKEYNAVVGCILKSVEYQEYEMQKV